MMFFADLTRRVKKKSSEKQKNFKAGFTAPSSRRDGPAATSNVARPSS